MKKKLISLLMALALITCIVPTVALAADSSSDEAYIMFADASWTYQYWGSDAEGIKATTATIDGDGEYTVGLDFTGTADGKASGVAFTALGIKTGEFTFPNATIEITSIKINGEEVELTKGYTSSDDGITTRMNIYNEWVADLPADARSFDGDIADSSAVMVAKEAFEAVETFEVTFNFTQAKDEAFIMYADASWTYQYWNDGSENPVVATNAEITGPGEYTVALDFTETETGVAEGVAFAAVGIKNGENTFPNYCINIKEMKVNGEAVEVAKGYTSSDDGITTRMNVYNEWVSELPLDARSFDGNTDESNWIIVDKEAFAAVETVEVTFEYAIPEAHAYIMFADAAWTYQYWGEEVDTGIVATDATVTGPGSYSVALDFTGTADGAATDVAFTAVGLKGAEVTHPGWFIRIDSIKINGEDVEYTKGYTSSDDGMETRMNIYNEWVSELPPDARSFDKNLDEAGWMIVAKEAFATVETMEVAFTYIYGEAPELEPAVVEIDEEAALAADYNAYFGIQTQNYIFRNNWVEENYGKGTDNWDHLTGWDSDNNAVDYGGVFTDTVIDGNGTYTVGVELGEMGLGTDETLRMLFVSTDIPSPLYDQGLIEITDFATSFDGAKDQSFFEVNTEADYIQIDILNEYSSIGTEAIPYSMPTEGITITFTISGFSKDSAAVVEEEPTPEPEPEATATPEPEPTAEPEPETSSLGTGAIIAIVAAAVVIIGGAAALLVISNKKKKDGKEE